MSLHNHNHYCDGKFEPEAYMKEAIARGFKTFGMSSHAPLKLPFAVPWTMKPENLDRYFLELTALKEKYKTQIDFKIGLEIDYIAGFASTQRFNHLPWDFLISSVHFVQAPNGVWVEIDAGFVEFNTGFQNGFGGNKEWLMQHYVAALQQMIATEKPDIVGHIDKIRINLQQLDAKFVQSHTYRDALRSLLPAIAKSKCAVEVNTRAMYKLGLTEPYPEYRFVEELYAQKTPLILTADAHHPREIDLGFAEVKKVFAEMGMKLSTL